MINSISCNIEFQSDNFDLNGVRRSDAFATAMLKLSTCRKLEPARWEETVIYDHPSERIRIAAVMRRKKVYIGDFDLRGTATLP